ncbi:hypothetical protein [Streptomyces tsukubensis]|uniref:TetR family transcriptional regulator n=1 Tax=Streptomyces tsukubensis TaxID=83656 RepID=A0A1V4A778_9ACTN|nr:hypothetical protein [Streptomyces tsukubensis]OON77293.1 hypothetical protein B1H18_18760 [Streptomyces tsukubensis]QFR92367.1 hypothetical protein GBW32_03985 [Streptomyces tsukubensis]
MFNYFPTKESLVLDLGRVTSDSPRTALADPGLVVAALLGLWSIQARALRGHLNRTRDPGRLRDAVAGDVRRAVRLLETGLDSFVAGR